MTFESFDKMPPFDRAAHEERLRIARAAPDLLEAAVSARSILANSGAESGYCMCGDPVDGHTFGSGHSPVDSHAYYAAQIVEQLDAAIAKATGQ